MRRMLLALALSLPTALFTPPAARAELIGATSGAPGALYTINPLTGQATLLVTPQSGGLSLVGVGLLGGNIYVSDSFGDNGAETVRIDRTTGAVTPVSNQGGDLNWHALAANRTSGLLYTSDLGGNVLSLNPISGAISTIGNAALFFSGLAYANLTGTLYGVTQAQGLYTINTTTAAATLIGGTGLPDGTSSGLGFDEDLGTLFLVTDPDPNGTNLYTLNLTTGSATLVGATGVSGMDGLDWQAAAAAVPEPATLALFGLALGGLALTRRRAVK